MTLVSSGSLSIGGTATNRSINLELSLAQNANSSLNQTEFRTLAGVASGTISIEDFYGKTAGGGATCQAQTFYYTEDNDPDEYCEIGQTNVTRYMNATTTALPRFITTVLIRCCKSLMLSSSLSVTFFAFDFAILILVFNNYYNKDNKLYIISKAVL